MKSIEHFMRTEREAQSPCKVTITLTADATFRARMSFATGMESAVGEGHTVAEAIERLESELSA